MDITIKPPVGDRCARCGALPSPDSSMFDISPANAKCCANCLVYTDFLKDCVDTDSLTCCENMPAPPCVLRYKLTRNGWVRVRQE